MQNNNPKPTIKNIEIGKFYFIHDGSKTGHPGLIVWKDDLNNLYIAIKFGSTANSHNFPLGRAVGKGIKQSFIYKRAFLGKRKDYSGAVLNDMSVSKEDYKMILNKVDLINLISSKNINRKDKRYIKKLMSNKKSPFQGQLSGCETRI